MKSWLPAEMPLREAAKLRVARALGARLFGYCEPDSTPDRWQMALELAETALGAAERGE